MPPFDDLKNEIDALGRAWLASQPAAGARRQLVSPNALTGAIVAAYHALAGAEFLELGSLPGVNGPKQYGVFRVPGGRRESRPFLVANRFDSEYALIAEWGRLIGALSPATCGVRRISREDIDRVVYAAAHYVASAFDIFSDNRASPGKFFEYLTGSLVGEVCAARLAARPTLANPAGYAVPVDVVIQIPGSHLSIILATKLTSRERIVQPFVHHLMVERAAPGRYKTLILCGSETNRLARPPGLQETCVPGTIEAYRQTLGNVNGIIYLDLPRAYKHAEFAGHIPVETFGWLLSEGLRQIYVSLARPTRHP